MKKLPDFLLFLCLIAGTTAYGQDSLLLETLKANQYSLQLDGGRLRGVGADFLTGEAASNQFMLIGEDHGIAELPQFTAALYRHIQPTGYRYFATETGPFTAGILQSMASRSTFLDDLRDTLSKYPWSIPFYTLREEAEMLQSIMDGQNPSGPVIWGLDQEFIGSPRLHFPMLVEQAADRNGTRQLRTYAERAMQGFTTTMRDRNPSSILFYSATRDDFAAMRTALNDDPAANRLLNELEESWEIYRKYFTGEGYASNRQRAEMMKRHFQDYYEAAAKETALPKVLFKFGANHIYRGANGLNVFDIGNYVNELASKEGTGSFHIYVVGKAGTKNAYTPFADESAKKAPYNAKDYLDRIDLRPVLALSEGPAWSLFDLRPIRHLLFSKKLRDLDPALEKVIWSYDAFLVIPEVHAATEVVR